MANAVDDLIMAQTISAEHHWVKPAYHGQSIINLMNSILAHFGVESGSPLTFHSDFSQSLHGKRKILFLFIDGLGWFNIAQVAQRYPIVDELFSGTTKWPITTVSPSTTSTATASYLTALTPAEHGVLGFLMYFPEYHRVFNMLGFRSPDRLHEDLITLGFRPEQYIKQPTILQRLEQGGVFVGAYNSAQYVQSGLSRMVYSDHLPYPYVAVGDMCSLVQQLIDIDRPQFQFLYWSSPDTVAHLYGAGSDAYANEVMMLFSVIKNTLLPMIHADKDAALVLCADHGHIDGDDEEAINLALIPDMMDLFRIPPTGEGRATQLFIRSPYIEQAIDRLSGVGNMRVMTKDAFLASGLLGDTLPCPDLLERIGDLVVFPYGTRRTLYPYETRPHTSMVGRHGGLSPEEMIVPLLVFV